MDDPASVEEREEVVAATFKVLVLGNTDVGKSTLINLYCNRRHPGKMMPTIGVDFTDIIVNVRGTKVKLRIWDTAGQERFHTFTKQFFRGAHVSYEFPPEEGIVLVYDITSLESFQTLLTWIQTIQKSGLQDVSMVIVGNKCDLKEARTVPVSHGEQLAKRHGQCYLETSATTGHNVGQVFYNLAETLIHSHDIFQPGQEAASDTGHDGDITISMILRDSPPRSEGTIRLEGHSTRKIKCCHRSSSKP